MDELKIGDLVILSDHGKDRLNNIDIDWRKTIELLQDIPAKIIQEASNTFICLDFSQFSNSPSPHAWVGREYIQLYVPKPNENQFQNMLE